MSNDKFLCCGMPVLCADNDVSNTLTQGLYRIHNVF